MFLTFILSQLSRSAAYVWRPAVKIEDPELVSVLIPHAQY